MEKEATGHATTDVTQITEEAQTNARKTSRVSVGDMAPALSQSGGKQAQPAAAKSGEKKDTQPPPAKKKKNDSDDEDDDVYRTRPAAPLNGSKQAQQPAGKKKDSDDNDLQGAPRKASLGEKSNPPEWNSAPTARKSAPGSKAQRAVLSMSLSDDVNDLLGELSSCCFMLVLF
jgi:hypothetical protein